MAEPSERVREMVNRAPGIFAGRTFGLAGAVLAASALALTASAGEAAPVEERIGALEEENERLSRELYAARVALAQVLAADGDVAGADDLLDACPARLRGWEWGRAHREARQELFTLPSYRMAGFSPDGKGLVFKASDGSLRAWDVATGRAGEPLPVRPKDDSALARGASLVVIGHTTGRITVWDAHDGSLHHTLVRHESEAGRGLRVQALSLSPDGARLASKDSRGLVKAWDLKTGAELFSLKGTGSCDEAYSPDGGRLALACNEGMVKLLDAGDGREILAFGAHRGRANSVAYGPDGGELVSAGDDGLVKIWDAETGRELAVLKGHRGVVLCAAFSPDGRTLASGGQDRTIRTWDRQKGVGLLVLRGHEGRGVHTVWFSPDGRHLASCAYGPRGIKLWDAELDREVTELVRRVVTKDESRKHADWYKPGSREVAKLEWPGPRMRSPSFSSPRKRLVSSTQDRAVRSLAFLPGGRLMSVSVESVKTWDLASARRLMIAVEHAYRIVSAAPSADGLGVVALNSRGEVRVADAETGGWALRCEISRPPQWSRFTGSALFTPDGRRLFTHARGEPITAWDTETGEEVARAEAGQVLAASPDGNLCAAMTGDYSPRILDMRDGSLVAALDKNTYGHYDRIAAFSPDGTRLAWCTYNVPGAACGILEAATGEELVRLERRRSGHPSVITFSPDARRVVAACRDPDLIRVWDAESGSEVASLSVGAHRVTSLAFGPDGTRLAVGCESGAVFILEADQWDPTFDAAALGGHRYKAFRNEMTWTEARRRCRNLGGHLVTITSPRENRFVSDLAGEQGGDFWIGFTDERVEGQWEWVTGEPADFAAWSPGQPDDWRQDEDQAHLWQLSGRGGWNDNNRLSEMGYVCEWEAAEALPPVTPQPRAAEDAPPPKPYAREPDELRRGLVGHWTFDEGTGDTAHDSSGNGVHAKLRGAKWVKGRIGSALDVGGTKHGAVAHGFPPSAEATELTVAMWFNWRGYLRKWQVLAANHDRYSVHQAAWMLRLTGGGGNRFAIQQPRQDAKAGQAQETGKWIHVAVTVKDGEASFYQDAKLLGRESFSIGVGWSQTLLLGNAFDGILDDVRVYRRAFSQSEIRLLAHPEEWAE